MADGTSIRTRRRGWLSGEEFLDLVGASHIIPGPTSTELAIHIGHRRAGWAGLVVNCATDEEFQRQTSWIGLELSLPTSAFRVACEASTFRNTAFQPGFTTTSKVTPGSARRHQRTSRSFHRHRVSD